MEDGLYYYAPLRSIWGVWINHVGEHGVTHGEFVADFPTRDAARAFVFEKNGWNK